MRRAWLLAILLLLQSAGAGARSIDVLPWLRQSQLVFVGTVEKVHAATEAMVPVDHLTAIVRVEQVLLAPRVIGDALPGKRVTVQLERAANRGHSFVWFTRSWFYGSSLGVVEVGRCGERQPGCLSDRITKAEKRLADEKLSMRIVRAQLIVQGTVTAVETTVPPGERRGPFTEHDPDWRAATIAVEKVLKGDAPQELKVLFAQSTDVMWIDSPKLKQGETAVFLLQWNQEEKGFPASRRPGWTALDPLDVLPVKEIKRVQPLIQTPLLPPKEDKKS